MRELSFNDKIGLIEELGLADALAKRCRPAEISGADALLGVLHEEVRQLRNAVAHDKQELDDEWSVFGWMRLTLHLAQDLAGPTPPSDQ